MPTNDPRIDAYIENSRDFAKPILEHIRSLIHQTCPDVEETLKWSMPHFTYRGDMMCHFASFKEHCAFGFWKQSLIEGADFPEKNAMGSFGKIRSLDDLPDDKTLATLIKEAMSLNELGIKVKKSPSAEKKELVVPDFLNEALARNEKAAQTFNAFPYSCKKEYVEWITEAKTEPTREKRLASTIEWLSEGKKRNWKYEKC
jgi:uncharacterized protein YdeI (YjbR/CyaY-like superfamily)